MGDREHIIIVDDEADVRETFGEYLAMRGYEVSLADSGKALRDCLAGRTADLVLLDLNLPGEDGLTLARYLREETDAAIIMVTAADEAVDRVIGLRLPPSSGRQDPGDGRVFRSATALPWPGSWPFASITEGCFSGWDNGALWRDASTIVDRFPQRKKTA